MTCQEFEEISGAYVLDAVTLAEYQEAEAHLATCAKCRGLLQELRKTAAFLPLIAPQVEPPHDLWERLLPVFQQESNSPAVRSAQAGRRTSKEAWKLRLLAAAAAVLLLVLLGGMTAWNIALTHQVGFLQQQLAHLHTQQPGYLSVVTYQVEGTDSGQEITGSLLYFPERHLAVLTIHGLPPVQEPHVYQGWLVHFEGKAIASTTSIGLLNLVDGTASLSFTDDVTTYDAVAVSLEPGPLATPDAPKGEVVALGVLK
jgi:anti-sigma-K factor RskA